MAHKSRIIYMGTPEFSVPALRRLASQHEFEVCLAVTQPDRPRGRGKKYSPSPVKQAALELGIPVFQPEKIGSSESEERLSCLQPDFFVVTAFGQILPQRILRIPRIFPVNIHASLLPRYRGASPIQAAILNQDAETGITTMVMSEKMDAGDILLSSTIPIHEQDTAGDLHQRLSRMGADLIIRTLLGLLDRSIVPEPQDHSKATYAGMLKKADGKINWALGSRQILAHINAMTPWPGAFSSLGGKYLKILRAGIPEPPQLPADPGVIFCCGPDGIQVATGDGALVILELTGDSGKHLNAREFLCGRPIIPPARFDI